MLDKLRVFAAHDQERQDVDADIVADREQHERVDAPGSTELQRSVATRSPRCDATWQGEWARA